MDKVALVRHDDDIGDSLSRGIRLIGGFTGLKSPVIIKPNICTNSDNTGYSVTSVDVIAPLIRLILDEDDSVTVKIVESDSMSKYAAKSFDKFGYTELAEDLREQGYDVSTVDLSSSSLVPIKFEGEYFKDPELPAELVEPGYFVSVAQAKTHYLTFITGALKNWFGFMPEKNQSAFHSSIHEIILDLHRIVKADLSIIDARRGVEGWNGPNTKEIDAFLVGRSPVSVDAAMARLMGFDPEDIRHLLECSSHGLGTLDPEILGEPLSSLKVGLTPPK